MSGEFRVRELVLGIQGLALLRNAVDGDETFVRERVADIRRFALAEPGEEKLPDGGAAVSELDAAQGYAAWSAVYDSLPSSYIEVEEPVVAQILDGIAPGVALDAACGTGRQTRALLGRGHRVIGVDQSPQMLDKARAHAPRAELRAGHLERLPLDDDSVDLAICSLAMTHLPDLTPGVAELARVVRPGGRIVVTDMHPFVIALQGQCHFVSGSELAFVRNHVHLPSSYLAAFHAAGLRVRACHEPLFNGRLAPGGYEEVIADAARAAWDGLPIVVVWDVEVPAEPGER
ncbi:class I SAM-dependent methyltransferase [Streptomyces roseirectus]|uniref:Class I SAM-dependent methyltransferase n=1 Tax=Streptomyces roseirectus TaxID=2768066 RepID=A0A7H0IPV5_9ACTN|nr:class I SAM-dependent methyltransferase [Streptomyces roseirectus]QNP74821.1 class I SAM-dependent methyltransferase [Streptomyces roseirectus]